MAITRITGAQILQTYASPILSIEFEGYALQRLDTGRMAAVWKTQSGSVATSYISTLDALGVTHTAISVLDSAATSRTLSLPSLASNTNGGFFVAWEDDATATAALAGNTFGRGYNSAGAAIAAKAHLSTSTAGGEYTPTVARLGNGNYLVSWADTLNGAAIPPSGEILGRIYSAGGTAIGSEFQLNSTTAGVQFGTDTLALADGRTFVAWGNSVISGTTLVATELRGRFFSSTGVATGVDFQLDAIASGSTYQEESFELIGLGNGGFVVVWEEETRTSVEEIHFQRFTSAGVKAGSEFVVESVTGTNDVTQMITTELANGGFGIAWRVFNDASGVGTSHVRSFTMTGAETGTEVSLNAIAAPGLTVIVDLELMADGRVMGFGFAGQNRIATQVFDFGDERVIGSSSAEMLNGREGVNDIFLAGAGNDTVRGLSGNDSINGDGGNDTLIGGAGSDTFVFNSAPSATTNADTITDFNVAADTINIENGVFIGLGPTAGTLAAVKFFTGAAAHDADDRIIYNATTGVLSFDADGNGAGAAIKFATLTTKPVLTNADFFVI
ncbi:MAG: hypothetical protein ABL897_15250 [Hyphomicrobium sp.]